jgi:hypothetical protein
LVFAGDTVEAEVASEMGIGRRGMEPPASAANNSSDV